MTDSPGPDIAQQLRDHGQVTAQRIAVMEAVNGHPHATTEELADSVRDKIGSISRQAVYDTLGVFVEKNLIRRIQPGGRSARYEAQMGDQHHHLVRRGCDLMHDIDHAWATAEPHQRTRGSRSTNPRSFSGAGAPPPPA